MERNNVSDGKIIVPFLSANAFIARSLASLHSVAPDVGTRLVTLCKVMGAYHQHFM